MTIDNRIAFHLEKLKQLISKHQLSESNFQKIINNHPDSPRIYLGKGVHARLRKHFRKIQELSKMKKL